MSVYTVSMLNGQSFHSEEGSTLLDAGLSSGITLPYSCKSGRCSSCKSKILSGKTRAFQPEVGLSVTQKAEGWVLSCVRTACSDITLDIEDISNFVLPPKGTWPCRIYKIERLSNDVVRVLLRIPPKSDFSSIPGQFIDVIGPNGIRRSYSLANVFVVNGFIELHIRAVANGVMSDYWFKHANENDLLRFHGPLGTFFLRPIAARDLIFLATGTGIAPVKAMLESLVDISLDVRPRSVTVFWGGRSVDDFYWDVHSIPVGQRFVPVLSRPTSSWMGEVGYVQDVFLKQNPELDNSVVYACGSNAMIQSAQEKLTQAGLSPSLFFSDAFVCSSP